MILAAESEPIREESIRHGRGKECQVAGYCVEVQPGLAVKQFIAKLLQGLAKKFPQWNPSTRAELKKGSFFLQLVVIDTCDHMLPVAPWFILGHSEQIHYLHIVAMYFSPWRPTFIAMEFMGMEDDGETLVLKATLRAYTAWTLFRHMVSYTQTWSAKCYKL